MKNIKEAIELEKQYIQDAEIKKINPDMVDFLIFFMKTGGWKKWYVSKSSIVFAMGKWYNATN